MQINQQRYDDNRHYFVPFRKGNGADSDTFEVRLCEKKSNIIQQMFCRFEGTKRFYCNRETTSHMSKDGFISTYQDFYQFGLIVKHKAEKNGALPLEGAPSLYYYDILELYRSSRNIIIFRAVIAHSSPLLPSSPPHLSRACCMVLHVRRPQITGTSAKRFNSASP